MLVIYLLDVLNFLHRLSIHVAGNANPNSPLMKMPFAQKFVKVTKSKFVIGYHAQQPQQVNS